MNFGRTSPSRRGKRRHVAKRCLKLEHLEHRSLLAGDVLITIVQGDIQITGDGDDNDIVITADPAIPGRFSIDTGADPTDINGGPGPQVFQGLGLRISMGGGNDTVTIVGDGGAGSVLPLNLTADLGNGDNIFSFTGGYQVTGGLRVQAAAGTDTITIDDVRARDMFFSTGSGGETIEITNSSTTSVTAGNLAVTSASAAGGSHNLTLENVQVAKNMDVIWGAGDSNTTLDDTQITGNLSIRTSTGVASVQIGTATEVNVGGDIYILTGNGNADIDLIGGTAKLVTIKTGVGEANINIVGVNMSKSLLITNGTGNDFINIDNVLVGKDISIVNSSGDHDISIDSGEIAGFIVITTQGGTQNFDFGANGLVSTGGSMSVRNGVTGEVTFNAVNLDIGNAFSVITGIGTHTIDIGSGDGGGVSVARGLAVRSDGGAVVTMDNVQVGLDLSVTLGNTLGLSEMFIGTNAPLTVVRNASFRTGLGDTNITIGAIDIGGNLIVQARQGTNTFTIGGISGIGDLFVGAQTIIASGNGEDILDIGTDSGATSTFIGMFNLNAGNGDDSVTIGEGTTGDAFADRRFTLDGSFGDDTLVVTAGTAFDPFDPLWRKNIRNFITIDI